MPRTLRLPSGSYMRRLDVQNMTQYLYAMQCVEIVGFSNVGKSALTRLLAQEDVWIQELGEAGQEFLPVYIDCNRMLGVDAQGFYELVLRCLRESSDELANLPELTAAYETLVAPASNLQVPLSFDQGLTAVLQTMRRKLVLIFDEFDEPFTNIDSRVFLNLRAKKDRYSNQLAYMTATVDPLARLRPTEYHCSEFCELFSHRTWYLAPLTRSDVDRMIRRYRDAYDVPFVPADFDFIYQWAGGHPCLIEGVCRLLEAALDGDDSGKEYTDPADRWPIHTAVARLFRLDDTLSYECGKIWDSRDDEEKAALLALVSGQDEVDATQIADLLRKHILLKIEGKPRLFGRLMASYVQHQMAQDERPDSAALWVDVDSGEVAIGGEPIETLTNLEYRLMLLLFQNASKIINKYDIVTQVWGDSYIDEVDDARIEKLVSRLRQKVEPEPANPRFLTTVRGRGYRLLLS